LIEHQKLRMVKLQVNGQTCPHNGRRQKWTRNALETNIHFVMPFPIGEHGSATLSKGGGSTII
jgi:hypothetical protein